MQETFQEFEDKLRKYDSKESQSRVLGRYSSAIIPNFIPWLKLTQDSLNSSEAREEVRKNIEDEIKGDHPGMLRRFVSSAGIVYSPDTSLTNLRDLHFINGDVFYRSPPSSLRKIAALAVMENTSLKFIPVLESYARSLGGKDFEYTQVHGEADIEHAKDLYDALRQEFDYLSKDYPLGFREKAVRIGATHAAEFLLNILNADVNDYLTLD